VTTIKHEYTKILFLGFIKCKALNCKALRENIFERGYYDMTQKREYMGLKAYVMG
jgi:hypothetical protein